jgi:ferrochelatase
MNTRKKGILLVNLGTPDTPSVPDVKRYLKQFLMDGRVLDIPYLQRTLLVKGAIVPKRGPQSAKLYQQIWDAETGSPLMHYSLIQQKMLQEALGDEYHVELAMRYQNPSIESALNRFQKIPLESLRIIPLFPQYASATTGSIMEEVMRIMQKWNSFPSISILGDFYNHPTMIEVFAKNASQFDVSHFDHVLFSYHGLPISQLQPHCMSSCTHHSDEDPCRQSMSGANTYCYVGQCYETTRLIAKQMELEQDQYSVCFQSRLGKTPWIQPYTSDMLKTLADQGKKRLLVLCPAFVADCIETIHEIGVEYAEEFGHMGGQEVQLVPSLNDDPRWIDALVEMATSKI